MCRLSLVAASRDYSVVACKGFFQWLILLQNIDFRAHELQQLEFLGLVTP